MKENKYQLIAIFNARCKIQLRKAINEQITIFAYPVSIACLAIKIVNEVKRLSHKLNKR